ncbi:MAG: hypothetical protein INH41_16720 [Myxococcaceae bacterium]|jgi:hypothetical protein|nr:hypothetical protein [Myxococcaceae bacterium]MCA3014026.1 hypothetical protein [Myxococcaceae bacterium]
MFSRRFLRLITLATVFAVASTGCMLSRAVDRAFLGITVTRPTYEARKTTGVFLLPLTFAVDVATFPIQALLVVLLGDNFPFKEDDRSNVLYSMSQHPQLQRLPEAQRAVAMREFEQLLRSGQLDRNSTLALTEDGHWVVVRVSDEGREQLLARAQAPATAELAVCSR